jgi:hypothetical protein
MESFSKVWTSWLVEAAPLAPAMALLAAILYAH